MWLQILSAAILPDIITRSLAIVKILCDRPESHLGLRSRLDLAPKRLESQLSHHLMTRLEVFVTYVGDFHVTMIIV